VCLAAATAGDEVHTKENYGATRDTWFQDHYEPLWEAESPGDPADRKEEVTLANCYISLSKGQIREVELMIFQFEDVLQDSLVPGQSVSRDPAHIYMK
jgi:hypothetical protein